MFGYGSPKIISKGLFMLSRAIAGIAAALSISSAASAADFIGYVSVTGGTVAHFEELGAQFPGAIWTSVLAAKGTFPAQEDCFPSGFTPTDACRQETVGGEFLADRGAEDLNQLFNSGLDDGQNGTGPADFWIAYTLDTGDRVVTTFHRVDADTWTSPTQAIPEPATWALMILGFGSVGAMMRRRRLVPD